MFGHTGFGDYLIAGFNFKPQDRFNRSGPSVLAAGAGNSAANAGAGWIRAIWTLTLLASAALTKSFFPTRGFIRVSSSQSNLI